MAKKSGKSGATEAPVPMQREGDTRDIPVQPGHPPIHPLAKNSVNLSGCPVMARSRITPADYNPRDIGLQEKVKLRNGLRQFGLVEPFCWNSESGNLVSGHQRMRIMDEEVGYNPNDPSTDYSLPVMVVALPPHREKELNVLLNNPGAQGWWHWQKLAEMAAAEKDFDAELAGFDPLMLKQSFESFANVDGLDFTHLFGKQEEDDAKADAETIRAMKANKSEYKEISGEMARDGFYLMLIARLVAEKEKFCELLGINPYAKQAELRLIASRIRLCKEGEAGLDIGYVPPPDPEPVGQGSVSGSSDADDEPEAMGQPM